MDIDLVNAAVGMKQARIMSQVQIAVAKKVMDADEMLGAGALQLLTAATTGIVQKGDALAAAATGLGGAIDTYA